MQDTQSCLRQRTGELQWLAITSHPPLLRDDPGGSLARSVRKHTAAVACTGMLSAEDQAFKMSCWLRGSLTASRIDNFLVYTWLCGASAFL